MTELTPMRIDGADVTTDDEAVVTSPYDGREVGRVPVGTAADIDRAVEVALARHRGDALPAHRRAEILDRAAVALADRKEELAQLISAESAKPITAARVEAGRAADVFRFSAAAARTFTGETVPMDASPAGEGTIGFTLRVPVGVVGAISPFNFPLNLVAHKVAPAIAAGCPVVLKPASTTPLTALALARILEDEAGLPAGWLNVVTAPGKVADRLVIHPDVAAISFTGSAAVGWSIRERAPRKRVGLELGNSSPVIVHHDADLGRAAERIAAGGYTFSGQVCISVQRVFVHDDVADELLELLDRAVGELVTGDPSDPDTDVSSLIERSETERVSGLVADAVAAGATVARGGDIDDHGVLQPTLLTGVSDDMDVSRTEVFGPVVGVQRYTSIDDAHRSANATPYGLQAGIFTSDISTALAAVHALEFGSVLVNEVPMFRADQMPYGGVGDSGNTKEGPAWAVRDLTEERMVVIRR